MTEKIISTRINKDLFNKMKVHGEVNWGAVVRNALISKIKQAEIENRFFDKKKARNAWNIAKKIRSSREFDVGKNSTEIIREWRDKIK